MIHNNQAVIEDPPYIMFQSMDAGDPHGPEPREPEPRDSTCQSGCVKFLNMSSSSHRDYTFTCLYFRVLSN